MGYELTFSHAFSVASRDHYINDCCFAGDVIAEHLLPTVKTAEHSDIETGQEDWGWYIWFRSGPLRMAIDIDCQDVDAGAFAIRVSARRPRRFLLGPAPVEGPELDQLRDRVLADLKHWLGVEPQVARFIERA
jgi:hypothetical protein